MKGVDSLTMCVDSLLTDPSKSVFCANIEWLKDDVRSGEFIIVKAKLKKMLEIVEKSIKEVNDEGL